MRHSERLLSRQPIYGVAMNVAAYELRSNELELRLNEFPVFQLFTEPALDVVVGEHAGLINLTSRALAEGIWKSIPKSRVMLGYFHDFSPNDEVAKRLTEIA